VGGSMLQVHIGLTLRGGKVLLHMASSKPSCTWRISMGLFLFFFLLMLSRLTNTTYSFPALLQHDVLNILMDALNDFRNQS
jgi:hypothetical protein